MLAAPAMLLDTCLTTCCLLPLLSCQTAHIPAADLLLLIYSYMCVICYLQQSVCFQDMPAHEMPRPSQMLMLPAACCLPCHRLRTFLRQICCTSTIQTGSKLSLDPAEQLLPAARCLLFRQTAHIPAADLLYVNYNNLVEGLLPYSVVLDAARRCVVVAIRGSLSVEDCVTGGATAAAAAAAAAAEGLRLGGSAIAACSRHTYITGALE
jgi:hypothetical protein